MTEQNVHDGRLEQHRATHVYTAACSCGWTGAMNDKGRARRELALHLTDVGVTDCPERPAILTIPSKAPKRT